MARTFPQVDSPPQASAEVVVNEAFETLEHQAVYGKDQATTLALTWGYYGGRWGGFVVAAGTFALTASSTNYVVAAVATGVTTCSTSATNWNNGTDYKRIYQITTTTVVTAVEDHRAGPGGVHGSGGGGSGGSGVISWKDPVRAASTANGTLASAFENGDVLDGVTLVTGDRILLKDQTSATENGIYVVAASGAPARAVDADAGSELLGATVFVSEGTANADRIFSMTTNAPISVGATSLTWTQQGATTIANSSITYAKIQDVSATSRVLGRKTAGAGVVEELTLSELLDFISSAARGDILYRGSSTWARLAAGTAGKVLVTRSTSADPTWEFPLQALAIACSDETTALTAGTNKAKFINPFATAFNVTAVVGSLSTAQASGSIFTVDVNEAGTTILSTKLTIDNTETSSGTAATAAVISDASIAAYAEIEVDIDQVGDGTAKGLKIYLLGYPSPP